jgi:TfoX/Sxy family transcriptional regulator of competence genes
MHDDEIVSLLKSALRHLEIQSRNMFGGIGIFSEKIMFALIYNDILYFRSTREIAPSYSFDSIQFQHPSRSSKMPYWSVPDQVINDKPRFSDWADNAFQLAKSLKRK